jgi:TonB family protein
MKATLLAGCIFLTTILNGQDHLGVRWAYSAKVSVSYDIIGTTLSAPQPEKIVYPEYPLELIAAHIQGEVGLACGVTNDGKPDNVRVSKASTSSKFDEVALDAVRNWKFKRLGAPPNKYPHPVQLTVTIRFELPQE